MLLALDARNASVSVGVADSGGAWKTRFRVGAHPGRSADEWVLLLRAFLDRAGIEARDLDGAILACVVPALAPRLREACAAGFGLDCLAVGPGVKNGLKLRVDSPAELGADLVCDAVAARALLAASGRADASCLVVDYGSAIAISALSGRGEFMGAAIAPGPEAAALALARGAALLPEARLEAPALAIGRNSAAAMQSGLILGFSGLVDRLVERMAAELGEPCLVIGSGDAIGTLLAPSRGFFAFEPWLALDGLRAIAALNPPMAS